MSKILITAFALTLLLSSSIAAADTTSTAGPKSRGKAVVYSLFSTLVPVVVGSQMMDHEKSPELGTGFFSLGLVIGPGVGHIYAGNSKRFWSGTVTRGLVLSSSVLLAVAIVGNSSDEEWDQALGKVVLAGGVIGAGLLISTISAIRDIAAADNSVDEYNKKHGFSSLTLKPIYIAAYKAPGLVLKLTF